MYGFLRNSLATLLCIGTLTAHAETSAGWQRFSNDFIEATFAIDPVFAVHQGRHEYDGGIPDLSRQGVERQARHYRDWMQRALEFDPAGLSDREAFERDLLIWACDSQLFWIETARWPFRNPDYYSRIFSPSIYVTREYAPPTTRLVALTRHLEAVPAALGHVRGNLADPLPRPYIERAIGFFGGLAGYLERDVPTLFASVTDPGIAQRYSLASAAAVRAYREMESWLRAMQPRARDDFALGADVFSEMLRRTELVDEPLASLSAWNERDQARNRAALEVACRDLDARLSIEQCIARVNSVKPAAGPVARAAELLELLRRFVVEHDLVSVPLPDVALVAEAPPYRRANSAYIERPGPLEAVLLPSIFYIAPPDPAWSPSEQRAYLKSESGLLFTSAHEVWPGHFLQGLHERAFAGPLGRMLRSGTFSEGWAHYAEEMMWESGLGDGDPAIHVAQLTGALMRNVRFRSAIGLHTQGMTIEASQRLFRDDAFLDPGNARQQAARGTYDPGYLAYTLGKLQILALRDAWTAPRGGRSAWKAFHDGLLSYGAAPVPLVRRYMRPDEQSAHPRAIPAVQASPSTSSATSME